MTKYADELRATIAQLEQESKESFEKAESFRRNKKPERSAAFMEDDAKRRARIAGIFKSALRSWMQEYPGKSEPAYFFLSKVSSIPIIPIEFIDHTKKEEALFAEKSILQQVSVADTVRMQCPVCRAVGSVFAEWTYVPNQRNPEGPLILRRRKIFPCTWCRHIFIQEEE
jgi:hypothetical protein